MSETPAPTDLPAGAGVPSSGAAPAPAAPGFVPVRRRRRWLRRTVATLVVLVVLVALAPLAVGLPFVRTWMAGRASEAAGLPITIAGASAWWTSGIDLEGVVVASPPGYDGPLATVDKVHVDVALGRLLGGEVDADVQLTAPKVTLRRRADGRWNLADLKAERAAEAPKDEPAKDRPAKDRAAKDGPGPRLHVTVTDGVVEAHGLGERVERVSKIAFRADLAPDGAMEAAFDALAEQAGVDGKDVAIRFSGGKAPGAETPVEVTFPDVDLARVSALTEGLTGWQGVRGTARVDAKGVFTADGGVRGNVTLAARGIEARTADGVRVALGTVNAKADLEERAVGVDAAVAVTLEQVEVVDGTGPDARTLAEPSVTVKLDALLEKDGNLRVAELEVVAGQALTLRSAGPLSISAPDAEGRLWEGKANLSADLAKLAALKSFVPALAPLRSGSVVVGLHATGRTGASVALGARVTNLVLAPGDLAPEGYAEADVTLSAYVAFDDEYTRVLVYEFGSAVARLKGEQPFETRVRANGVAFQGPLDLVVNLEALSRACGGALGLAKGERLRGTFGAKGTSSGTDKDGRLDAVLTGRDLAFPASWGPSRAPGTLDGNVALTWTPTAFVGDIKDLRGLGLDVSAQAALKRDANSTAFDGADVTVGADLAYVRAFFGGRMGLAPAATLVGRLQSTLRASSTPSGRRVDGTTQVAGLIYRGGPDAALLEEPALTLEHALVLPQEGGPLALETARVRGNGYSADLSGSSVGTGATTTMDLVASIEGEAARLAERVRAFVGREYQDLAGSGRVSGKARFASTGAPSLLAGGTTSADLALGTWSAGGATLADGRLTLARANASVPYQAALLGTLNQGPASIGLGVTPKGEALAWRLVAGLKGVDLSTVLVNHGAGKYLGWVLPTLVPTDKATPVLSGRLDADVELAAADLAGDAMTKTLAGRGNVVLTQGTVGESTLFAAIGGGDGLGDVGKALRQVAPEVVQELANFQRALAFQSLTSRFEVKDERIEVQESQLVGHSSRIDMNGVVGFDQRVDLATRIWFGSKAGECLKRVVPDQTLPLRVTHTLEKPHVVPDVRVGDLLKSGLQRFLEGAGDDVGDAAKRIEEEAKKLRDRLFGK